jgi:hypothetical protein
MARQSKLLKPILLSVLLANLAFVVRSDIIGFGPIMRTMSAGSSCAQFQDDSNADTNIHPIGNTTANWYVAQHFWTSSSAHSLCKISARLTLGAGTIAGVTYRCDVWNASWELIQTSADVAGSDSWNGTVLVDFAFSPSVTLAANTQYHFAFYRTGSADANNYARIYSTASSVDNGYVEVYTNTKAYSNDFQLRDLQIKLYAE